MLKCERLNLVTRKSDSKQFLKEFETFHFLTKNGGRKHRCIRVYLQTHLCSRSDYLSPVMLDCTLLCMTDINWFCTQLSGISTVSSAQPLTDTLNMTFFDLWLGVLRRFRKYPAWKTISNSNGFACCG